MNRSNHHSHTTFCDGRATPEEFIIEALKHNFRSFGFSAHAPLPFKTEWNMDIEKMDGYIEELNRLKREYSDKIEIYIGLECDYLSSDYHAAIPYFQNLETDYLISSVHYITNAENGEMMTVDGTIDDFNEGLERVFGGSIEKLIREYFLRSMLMVEKGGFDVIGHIDKLQQNGHLHPKFDLHNTLYSKSLHDLFCFVKERELIVEVNTKSYNPKGMIYPNPYRFRMLKEMNIPIQVNSDSHHPDLIEDGFDIVFRMLKGVGFTHTRELVKGVWRDLEMA